MNLQSIHRLIKPELTRTERILKDCLFNNGHPALVFAEQLSRFKGKKLRPILLLLSAQAAGGTKPIHFKLATVVELIHNASLVHDDVLDEATLRRNHKTINQRWGNESSILFGDYLFSHAFLTCLQVKSEEVNRIISQTAFKMCYGELTHTGRKFDLSLSEAEYLEIIQQKTAALFSAACQLGALFATNERARTVSQQQNISRLTQYGLNFGMAYQIIDDYLDIASQEKDTGKTGWSDLSKGKITLPIIRLIQSLPAKKRNYLQRLISPGRNGSPQKRSRTKIQDRSEIIKLLNEHDALSYTLQKARDYVRQAQVSLNFIKDSEAKLLLQKLAGEIVPR
ncbi:MAG: polyprenyl synthetase family protein [Planctomycetota bacterium]